MYKKICPDCNQASFSASRKTNWKCPNCGKDLTNVQAKPLSKEDIEGANH